MVTRMNLHSVSLYSKGGRARIHIPHVLLYILVFHTSMLTKSHTNCYGYDDGITQCKFSVYKMAEPHNAVCYYNDEYSLAVIVLDVKLGLSMTTLGTN